MRYCCSFETRADVRQVSLPSMRKMIVLGVHWTEKTW